jgi:hypothetical protein
MIQQCFSALAASENSLGSFSNSLNPDPTQDLLVKLLQRWDPGIGSFLKAL